MTIVFDQFEQVDRDGYRISYMPWDESLSKYEAYTAHLTQLSKGSSVKAVDQAKLKGYLRKWIDAQYLLGCPVFVDVLLPCSIFSKSMQSDSLDIIGALTCLVRTVKETKKLRDKPLPQWPTYSTTISKVVVKMGSNCTNLRHWNSFRKHNHTMGGIMQNTVPRLLTIWSRLESSDLQLIKDVVTVLATQSWQKILEHDSSTECVSTLAHEQEDDPLPATNRLIEHFNSTWKCRCSGFSNPRRVWGNNFLCIPIHVIIHYGPPISLVEIVSCSHLLRVVERPPKLLFSLPVSNGKTGENFSQLNLIKNKQTSNTQQSGSTRSTDLEFKQASSRGVYT